MLAILFTWHGRLSILRAFVAMDPNTPQHTASVHDNPAAGVRGEFLTLDGEEMYRIAHVDRIPPFLINLVSDCDLWMFLSSTGGLTAGRVREEGCLFPYQTEDWLHRAYGRTGPITILRLCAAGGKTHFWEPFSPLPDRNQVIHRFLWKNRLGNRVIFEEENATLQLAFRYQWSTSEEFGFVRSCHLVRAPDAEAIEVELLDGLLNIMPPGVDLALQQGMSCLVDAYKRSEYLPGSGLGLFSLSSMIIDRAEPAEALVANVVWALGLEGATVSLDEQTVSRFREGRPPLPCHLLTGSPGAFLQVARLALAPGRPVTWTVIADADRDQVHVSTLQRRLQEPEGLDKALAEATEAGTRNLLAMLAAVDGLQCCAEPMVETHHLANCLFNIMRGGVFLRDYSFPVDDFRAFVRERNRRIHDRHQELLDQLPPETDAPALRTRLEFTGDSDLIRIGLEYLPLIFSRRHGDPSRPWNRFEIRVRDDSGRRVLHYQGNWRDIFQNWEALGVSFPGFLEAFIARFVNASTVDGFNPYRVLKTGIDWEAPDPNSPWATIGYWGDHQVVYLLRLLEALDRHDPEVLPGLLDRAYFSYANVPYRLKPYESILENHHQTVEYDRARAQEIAARVRQLGSDGKLVIDGQGCVYLVTLAEKLLVTALCKLSSLVPDGGIWMNTQRPEWNDANNALAGNGLSIVTQCYLHRFLHFCMGVFRRAASTHLEVSREVIEWMEVVSDTLSRFRRPSRDGFTDTERRRFMDEVGEAFAAYRARVYTAGFSGKAPCRRDTIISLLETAAQSLHTGIRRNRRQDGLYHSYNLIQIGKEPGPARLEHLYEMLEGQVAALGSGALDPAEAVEVIHALFRSNMYRPDQESFMLYPDRSLAPFLEKNVVPAAEVEAIGLLLGLTAQDNREILAADPAGHYRFHSTFRSAPYLARALDRLAQEPRWRRLVETDRQAVLALYERVFRHRSFTGRSGAMYAYEGLGSIYWHMVSKLLLAVQERFFAAVDADSPPDLIASLGSLYYRIRAGLGFNKTVLQYGAFPFDPYSHTPAGSGARQPGMTGQVKEEILTRFGELGLRVETGTIRFEPRLLRRSEFLRESRSWRTTGLHGREETLTLPASSLGFTCCQVPIVYRLESAVPRIAVTRTDGARAEVEGLCLTRADSRSVFGRRGDIARVDVSLPPRLLFRWQE